MVFSSLALTRMGGEGVMDRTLVLLMKEYHYFLEWSRWLYEEKER